MKIVIIDNYDSFTYNLVHYFEALNCTVTVYRNDEFELNELTIFDAIVLSPGPGIPSEAGLLLEVIKHYCKTKKILGICLGMQAIAQVFGGTLRNLKTPFHGVFSTLKVVDKTDVLFANLPQNFRVGRYHSWVVNETNFPANLKITATTNEHEIMALRHVFFDVCGVQFHPESILTEHGKTILNNWILS